MFDNTQEPRVEMSQRSLRTLLKVAKTSVTRKINEITSLMSAVENVNVIIASESEFDEAMENFYRAHEVSLLRESGSLTQERLRLQHQEKLLKLRTEIAEAEARERVYSTGQRDCSITRMQSACTTPTLHAVYTQCPHTLHATARKCV